MPDSLALELLIADIENGEALQAEFDAFVNDLGVPAGIITQLRSTLGQTSAATAATFSILSGLQATSVMLASEFQVALEEDTENTRRDIGGMTAVNPSTWGGIKAGR